MTQSVGSRKSHTKNTTNALMVAVTNSPKFQKQTIEQVENYDIVGLEGQSQLGREYLYQREMYKMGCEVVSTVLVKKDIELEIALNKIKAYEYKFGRKLTEKELNEIINNNDDFIITPEEVRNTKLVGECLDALSNILNK